MLESLSLSIISDHSSLFSLSYIFISEMAFINFFFTLSGNTANVHLTSRQTV